MISTARLLEDYVQGRGARPFDWAAANCCHFAAEWVAQATGRNPMEGLAVTETERAARRLIRALGGSVEAAWSKQLGAQPIATALAQTGDLALLLGETPAVAAVGVCCGRWAYFVEESGAIVKIGLERAAKVWRLPRRMAQ